jgi:hypothetical protein
VCEAKSNPKKHSATNPFTSSDFVELIDKYSGGRLCLRKHRTTGRGLYVMKKSVDPGEVLMEVPVTIFEKAEMAPDSEKGMDSTLLLQISKFMAGLQVGLDLAVEGLQRRQPTGCPIRSNVFSCKTIPSEVGPEVGPEGGPEGGPKLPAGASGAMEHALFSVPLAMANHSCQPSARMVVATDVLRTSGASPATSKKTKGGGKRGSRRRKHVVERDVDAGDADADTEEDAGAMLVQRLRKAGFVCVYVQLEARRPLGFGESVTVSYVRCKDAEQCARELAPWGIPCSCFRVEGQLQLAMCRPSLGVLAGSAGVLNTLVLQEMRWTHQLQLNHNQGHRVVADWVPECHCPTPCSETARGRAVHRALHDIYTHLGWDFLVNFADTLILPLKLVVCVRMVRLLASFSGKQSFDGPYSRAFFVTFIRLMLPFAKLLQQAEMAALLAHEL